MNPQQMQPERPARRAGSEFPVVRINGVSLHAITEAACIDHVINSSLKGYGGIVLTPNLDHLRRCRHDLSFIAMVTEADLVVADGMPLIWASRLQGTPLPERIAGSDLISSLSAAAARTGRRIFLLGGAPGTAEGAAAVLRQRHPEIQIAGTYCPPFGFEKDEREMGLIVNALTAAKPDIIFVGLGSPKQEWLIQRIRNMVTGVWWLGIGNSFSFLCGDVARAPRWMQKTGIEWVHRLCQEPRRLFKRYIVYGLPFAAAMMGKSILKGLPVRLRLTTPPAPEIELRTGDPTSRRNGRPRRNHDQVEDSAVAIDRPNGAIAMEAGSAAAGRLSRLRSVVLLGGSVRTTPLTSSIGRSLLDLPLDESGTILQHWVTQVEQLGQAIGRDDLPIRVLVNQQAPEPKSAQENGKVRVEQDFGEYRGTGGVLGDIAADYADDDLILVSNAAQVLIDPLVNIAADLDAAGGQVSLISHQDGTPSSLMLITCGALRLIPRSGFVDMKEQALPEIAKRHEVKVAHKRRPTGLPIRSLAEYVSALRHYHRRRIGKPAGGNDPLAEDWRPAFAIVEQGASVDPNARVHDGVILRGGRVEAGAVVVRSVVCDGGLVRRDQTAVDRFVCNEDEEAVER